jgi:hypothetical protein
LGLVIRAGESRRASGENQLSRARTPDGLVYQLRPGEHFGHFLDSAVGRFDRFHARVEALAEGRTVHLRPRLSQCPQRLHTSKQFTACRPDTQALILGHRHPANLLASSG